MSSLLRSSFVGLVALVTVTASAATAPMHNQQIQNFHYSNCSSNKCIEVWSDIGVMSQLKFAFSTIGATRVKISDLETHASTSFEGNDASYLPTLNCITLASADGTSRIIHVDDFSVETFGRGRK